MYKFPSGLFRSGMEQIRCETLWSHVLGECVMLGLG